MTVMRHILVPVLALSLALLPATLRAQQATVVDRAGLDAAVAARTTQMDEDRQAIYRMLDRQQVRDVAVAAGIDLKAVSAAVATLDGEQLERIAQQARDVNNSLAGGQAVTISVTTIIIVLLIVILLIVVAD